MIEDESEQVVRSFYEAMADMDVPAVLALARPDIVVIQSPRLPWGGRFQGRDAFAGFAAGVRAHVASVVEIERHVVSGDRVAAIGRTRGHVVASGRRFDVPLVHLFTIDQSMIARLELLVDVRLMRAALV